jgi:hypothetical protein
MTTTQEPAKVRPVNIHRRFDGSNSQYRTVDILALSIAVSPLTHNSGSEGNETLVNTEVVVTSDGPARCPVLSGNALRHKTVRDPGAAYLVERYGLDGQLSLALAQFFFAGGSLTKSTGQSEKLSNLREMYRLFPLIRVIGGCLPDHMIPGSLHCWRGTLVCSENEPRLRRIVPDGWIDGMSFRPAREFWDKYQYTRNDPAASHVKDLLADADGETNQMIYNGETVLPGSAFVHGYRLENATEVDVGALLWSLARWQALDSTIGGQAAKGHGRLAMALAYADDLDAESCVTAYLQHTDAVREDALQFLNDTFAKTSAKAKKKKGK